RVFRVDLENQDWWGPDRLEHDPIEVVASLTQDVRGDLPGSLQGPHGRDLFPSRPASSQETPTGQSHHGPATCTRDPMQRALAGFQAATMLFSRAADGSPSWKTDPTGGVKSAPKTIPNWFQADGGEASKFQSGCVPKVTTPLASQE